MDGDPLPLPFDLTLNYCFLLSSQDLYVCFPVWSRAARHCRPSPAVGVQEGTVVVEGVLFLFSNEFLSCNENSTFCDDMTKLPCTY